MNLCPLLVMRVLLLLLLPPPPKRLKFKGRGPGRFDLTYNDQSMLEHQQLGCNNLREHSCACSTSFPCSFHWHLFGLEMDEDWGARVASNKLQLIQAAGRIQAASIQGAGHQKKHKAKGVACIQETRGSGSSSGNGLQERSSKEDRTFKA